MDRHQDFADGAGRSDSPDDAREDCAIDAPPVIGTDERRMHVRAYNHWVSLLRGRAYPSVEDLEPENIGDFGPHGVLLDFTGASETPAIAWLGEKLRTECDLPVGISNVADVPSRSLLSRLTDHHLQIIANRAPIGFEAEFVNARGHNAMYRGILLPFSSDDDTIDFIYGVINWKEVVDDTLAQQLNEEVQKAARATPSRPMVPVWADGPSRFSAPAPAAPAAVIDEGLPKAPEGVTGEDMSLYDWLATARESVDAMRSADSRSRGALYRALDQAYDFALLAGVRTEEYEALLADSGIVTQARAPMTPVVKLIFGTNYDKTRLTEFSGALSFARRRQLPAGGMKLFLENYPGGLKAIVAADRRERRPEPRPAKSDSTRARARALAEQAYLTLPGDDEFVILVARRVDTDRVAVIGVVPDDRPMIDRALRQIVD